MALSSIHELEEDDIAEDSMSLSDIYRTLLTYEEIILTIPAEQEEQLRKGLASVKAKANKKLVDQGFPSSKSTLAYSVTPVLGEDGKPSGNINVQISLGTPNAIRILAIRLPDNEI